MLLKKWVTHSSNTNSVTQILLINSYTYSQIIRQITILHKSHSQVVITYLSMALLQVKVLMILSQVSHSLHQIRILWNSQIHYLKYYLVEYSHSIVNTHTMEQHNSLSTTTNPMVQTICNMTMIVPNKYTHSMHIHNELLF